MRSDGGGEVTATDSRTMRRIGLIVLIAGPVAAGVALYVWFGVSTGWYFRRTGMPPFEQAREEPALVRAAADSVGVPAPPDLATLDEDAARHIYDLLEQLRQRPDDAALVDALGEAYESIGDRDGALGCYRRAASLDPSAVQWRSGVDRLSGPSQSQPSSP